MTSQLLDQESVGQITEGVSAPRDFLATLSAAQPLLNIVFYTPNFYPMIGGVESIVKGLATELTRLGHRVRVLTWARATEPDGFPFRVVRGVSIVGAVRHVWWADVVVHVNISLRGILPLLLAPRPLVVYHNGLYQQHTLSGRLKGLVARRMAINVGCSPFMARVFACATTIPDPYDDALFRRSDALDRTGDLLFVGRLVTDKGGDVLLRALLDLRVTHGLTPRLTIIGVGPEKARLEALTSQLRLAKQVVFKGALVGEALVRAMNSHRILVVPSNYDEPFGVVAIEGIACGCRVIGSDGGGLPDAMGDCGSTFPKGDHVALACKLSQLLTDPFPSASGTQVEAHLNRHTLRAVTEQFVTLFNQVRHA